MKHFHIRHGEPCGMPVPIAPVVVSAKRVQSAAFLGSDYPGLRPRFLVQEGQAVAKGQTVFVDRKYPEIAFVSPLSGEVSRISYGPRRMLSICTVTAKESAAAVDTPAKPKIDSPGSLRRALLSHGLWPAFRTRPFGRLPHPESTPQAIFVNAVNASPSTPDPRVVLADQGKAFQRGVTALANLTDGSVYICQSLGAALGPPGERIVHASFAGSAGAGLASTQIEKLCPVDRDRMVWSIGYQDVAAIGHLIDTGKFRPDRVVAVTSPEETRLVRTCLGARIADLGSDANAQGSGASYLGRYEDQVRIEPPPSPAHQKSWLLRLFPKQRALIPTEALARSLAPDLMTIPLLRALSLKDTEASERLGCLALVEEDLATATRCCTSGTDYQTLLRQVLDDLMAELA